MSFLYDSFTEGAGDVALPSHTGETGATWTYATWNSEADIATVYDAPDAVGSSAATPNNVYYHASGSPPSAEYDVTITQDILDTNNFQHSWACGRLSTSVGDGYYGGIDPNAGIVALYKIVGGSSTLLDSNSFSVSLTQYSVKLQIRDAAKKISVGGTEYASSADNSITAAGKAGIAIRNLTNGANGPIILDITGDAAGGTTITASLDSLVQKQNLLITASLDAQLQKSEVITANLDALVQAALSITSVMDSMLQRPVTKTASIDAAVQKPVTVTASLDAAVQKALSVVASIDAAVQKPVTVTASLDVMVQQLKSMTSSIDAVLITSGTTIFASLDALLQQAKTVTASLDAMVQVQGQTSTASMDSLLSGSSVLAATLDAILRKTIVVTASIDAMVKATGVTVSTGLDAFLSGGITIGSIEGTMRLYAAVEGSATLESAVNGTVTLN